jgi:hypothetical protein
MELKEIEVEQPDGTMQLQKSQVLIKKCRYLEQSGCVGLCVNICKVWPSSVTHSQVSSARCALACLDDGWAAYLSSVRERALGSRAMASRRRLTV